MNSHVPITNYKVSIEQPRGKSGQVLRRLNRLSYMCVLVDQKFIGDTNEWVHASYLVAFSATQVHQMFI